MNMPFMPVNPRVGFAYVPFQRFENLYNLKKGLERGTIFSDLDIPLSVYSSNPIMNPFK